MTTRQVALGGLVHTVVMRTPTTGETHAFVADPGVHRDEATAWEVARLQVFDAFSAVDGEPMSLDLAGGLVADEADRAVLLRRRTAALEEEMTGGRILLTCPSCGDGQWTGSLDELAAALGTERRAPADADGALRPFALSYAVSAPPPHPAPVAFVVGGTAGTLAGLDEVDETLAWLRWTRPGQEPEEGHEDRVFESAGFRAVLRMSCVLRGDDGRRIDLDEVEALSLGTFCFLDEASRLAFQVAGPRPVCPACAAQSPPAEGTSKQTSDSSPSA